MKRSLFAVIFGALSLLMVADIALGYYRIGSPPTLGTLHRIDNSRAVFTSVTPQGRSAGIRVGDVQDLHRMDLITRFRVLEATRGEAGEFYTVPLERNGRIVSTHIAWQPQATGALDILDVVLRFLLLGAGILLIARGVDRDSLWAGLFVCSLAVVNGFGYRYWGSPAVAIALYTIALVVYSLGMWGARLLFAFALMLNTVPRWLRLGLLATGSIAFAALYAFAMLHLASLFTGTFTNDRIAMIAGEWAVDVIVLASFGVAAVYADGRRATAIRWIFGAMLVSQAGPWINFAYTFNHRPLPLNGLLNVTFIVLAVVLPYAVLSRRLVAVNFVVSRALVYAIVLTVIVGVFILLEKTIEDAALGRFQSQVFELIVPLGLGLSVKWIERWAERIVERLLYRHKMRAEQELHALVDDFPHARDVQALSVRVVREICRQMHAPLACVYRESGSTYSPIATAGNEELLPVDADDPIFMRLRSKHAVLQTDDFATSLPRHSAVFPLVVFGAVTGAVAAPRIGRDVRS